MREGVRGRGECRRPAPPTPALPLNGGWGRRFGRSLALAQLVPIALTFAASCAAVVLEPVSVPQTQGPPKVLVNEKPREARPKKETLEGAIDLALQLTIEGRHEDMLARFLIPEEKERLLREGEMELLVKDVAENHVVELIDCLKYIRGKTPKMGKDGRQATFDLRGADSQRDDEITFVRIEGFWYIQ